MKNSELKFYPFFILLSAFLVPSLVLASNTGYDSTTDINSFAANGTTVMTLTGSTATTSFAGNVGIGTETPTAALDVNGGIRLGAHTISSSCSPEGQMAYDYTAHAPIYCNSAGTWQTFSSSSSVFNKCNSDNSPDIYCSITLPSSGNWIVEVVAKGMTAVYAANILWIIAGGTTTQVDNTENYGDTGGIGIEYMHGAINYTGGGTVTAHAKFPYWGENRLFIIAHPK